MRIVHNKWDNEKFLEALKENKSSLVPLEEYITMHHKMLCLCPCGNTWKVSTQSIRNSGPNSVCYSCARKRLHRKTHDEYLKELDEKSIDIKLLENYVTNNTKIKHLCTCNEEFLQSPTNIYRGSKCKKCHKHSEGYHGKSYYKDKPTYLYYIKINELYKIGITIDRGEFLSSINTRFEKDIKRGIDIKIITGYHFQNGAEAYELEQQLISLNKHHKYIGEDILISGNSELFTKNILA